MKEKLQPISPVNWRKPWSVVLWEIMVREAKGTPDSAIKSDIEQKFNLPDRASREQVEVEVELTINGVPVSFQKSVDELWERTMAQYEQRILEKAKELVSASRLGKLQEIIERAEWQLQEEIETLYNDRKSV
jgi:hypothetical protein